MRVLVCGSRNWSNRKAVTDFLETLPPDTLIINGGCRGADTIAKEEALKQGLEVITELADWKKYGRSAGPIRNQLMLDKHHPELVIAFHQNLSESQGTRDMIRRAKQRGTPVKIIEA